jgi:hypothetical protein
MLDRPPNAPVSERIHRRATSPRALVARRQKKIPDDVKQQLVRAHELLSGNVKNPKQYGMLQEPPAWLGLTPRDKRRAKELLGRIVEEYAPTCVRDLVWVLLVDAVRPRTRGRKPKWLGMEGVVFVGVVEVVLNENGWKRSRRKELRWAIDAVRKSAPDSYGRYTEDRLRAAYYDALPRYMAVSEDLRSLAEERAKRASEKEERDAHSVLQVEQIRRLLGEWDVVEVKRSVKSVE